MWKQKGKCQQFQEEQNEFWCRTPCAKVTPTYNLMVRSRRVHLKDGTLFVSFKLILKGNGERMPGRYFPESN